MTEINREQELQEWNQRAEVLRSKMPGKWMINRHPDPTPPTQGEMKIVPLMNAEELHRQYPEIFNFLNWSELESGDFAEVAILSERFCSEVDTVSGQITNQFQTSGERFWIEIESINDGVLTGRIANEISTAEEIKLNDRIQFHRSNFYTIRRREDAEKFAKNEKPVDNELRLRSHELFAEAVALYCTECTDIKMVEKLRAKAEEYLAENILLVIEVDQRILSERRARRHVAKSPNGTTTIDSELMLAAKEFEKRAERFEQRANQMVREGDFDGAKEQFEFSIRATTAAQRAEIVRRGHGDDTVPGFLLDDGAPTTFYELNGLGFDVIRNADGGIRMFPPRTAQRKLLAAYAFEIWNDRRKPPPLGIFFWKRFRRRGQPPGLLEAGNIDIVRYPVAKIEPDGTFDLRVIYIEDDDKIVLIPTVSPEGEELTGEEATQRYFDTRRHYGVFADVDSASGYHAGIAEAEEKRIKQRLEAAYAEARAIDAALDRIKEKWNRLNAQWASLPVSKDTFPQRKQMLGEKEKLLVEIKRLRGEQVKVTAKINQLRKGPRELTDES